MSTCCGVNVYLTYCLNCVLNVKALVGAFLMNVKTNCENQWIICITSRLECWEAIITASSAG